MEKKLLTIEEGRREITFTRTLAANEPTGNGGSMIIELLDALIRTYGYKVEFTTVEGAQFIVNNISEKEDGVPDNPRFKIIGGLKCLGYQESRCIFSIKKIREFIAVSSVHNGNVISQVSIKQLADGEFKIEMTIGNLFELRDEYLLDIIDPENTRGLDNECSQRIDMWAENIQNYHLRAITASDDTVTYICHDHHGLNIAYAKWWPTDRVPMPDYLPTFPCFITAYLHPVHGAVFQTRPLNEVMVDYKFVPVIIT